jgi:hypothetical protein
VFRYICFDVLRNAIRTAAWSGILRVMAIAKILRVFVNKITFQKWKIFRICRSILDKYSEKEICSCKNILT